MRDIAHPLNKETREEIDQRVIEEYQQSVSHFAVPTPDSQKRRGGSRSEVMDRLAAKLFNDDFWTEDMNRVSLDVE